MIAGLDFQNAITPWVLTALIGAFLIAFILTARSWREARRSPYFFQRRQALQEMQSYSLVSLALLVATFAVLAYAYSPNVVVAPRVKVLTSAKPVQAPRDMLLAAPLVAPVDVVSAGEPATAAAVVSDTPQLPPDLGKLTPTADSPAAKLSNLRFASAIDPQYQPLTPRTEFSAGRYTVYATFDYTGMADGMVWAWVWRHNGVVVNAVERRWVYGEDGPGWVYLRPETGFEVGDYTLELWVNGALMTTGNINIVAGVANQ